MAHFAKLDANNVVEQVIVIDNNEPLGEVVGVLDFGSEDEIEDDNEPLNEVVDVLVDSLVDDVEEDIKPTEKSTEKQQQEDEWQILLTQLDACINTRSKCLYFKDWEFIESFEILWFP